MWEQQALHARASSHSGFSLQTLQELKGIMSRLLISQSPSPVLTLAALPA